MTPGVTQILDLLDSFIKGWFHFEIPFSPISFYETETKDCFLLEFIYVICTYLYLYFILFQTRFKQTYTHTHTYPNWICGNCIFERFLNPKPQAICLAFGQQTRAHISTAKFLGWFAFERGWGEWLISSKSSSVETQIHSCCALRPARGIWDPGRLPDVYSRGKLSFLFLWKAKLFIFVCLFVELWKGSLNKTHSRAVRGRMLRDWWNA